MILAPIGLIAMSLLSCVFAEVFSCVDYFLRASGRGVEVCFFVLWQTGQGGVGMAAVVCIQTNQIFRCCHKIKGEWISLMAVTGEGQCR